MCRLLHQENPEPMLSPPFQSSWPTDRNRSQLWRLQAKHVACLMAHNQKMLFQFVLILCCKRKWICNDYETHPNPPVCSWVCCIALDYHRGQGYRRDQFLPAYANALGPTRWHYLGNRRGELRGQIEVKFRNRTHTSGGWPFNAFLLNRLCVA